jgi:hypothetical protein
VPHVALHVVQADHWYTQSVGGPAGVGLAVVVVVILKNTGAGVQSASENATADTNPLEHCTIAH